MPLRETYLLVGAAVLAACATANIDSGSTPRGDGGIPPAVADATSPEASDPPPPGPDGALAPDPFAPQPDTSAGLTNASTDLNAVLENGALAGACAAWNASPTDRRAMLLCGKSMFFDEGFGTTGVPKTLVTLLTQNFPKEIGVGFSKLGMIADPRSTEGLPLGFAPGAPMAGNIPTLAFTCASCHFAKLPDGRYAVGAPNHAYEYGKHNLAMAVFPGIAASGSTQGHDPDAVAVIQPLLDEVAADASLKTKVIAALLPLVGAASSAPTFPASAEHLYASWKSGTMDVFIAPLLDDQVHVIDRISPIWGIPTDAEVASSGMSGAMLGWAGSGRSLQHFFEGFILIGGGALTTWPDAKLAPIQAYVESLRAPAAPLAAPQADVDRGGALFGSAGCIGCHSGPRGSGRDVYDFDAIGTDPQKRLWTDPNLTGQPCCGITFPAGDTLTHGIKSPRLVGLWTESRFLHNGSVDSLESLLCVNGPRGDVTAPAYGNGGHSFGCDLPLADKTSLLAFLRAH